MGKLRLALCRNGEREHDLIVSLIEAAAAWLGQIKDTDQWAQPWRNEEDRSNRIWRDLAARKTWILWDGARAVGTITADPEDYPVWPSETLRERAVYVRRLVISRDYAGQGLGTSLLDWAGLTAMRRYGAAWISVDVWSTNKGLHTYYEKHGFAFCGYCPDPDYPSGALFQKPTGQIRRDRPLPFRATRCRVWRFRRRK